MMINKEDFIILESGKANKKKYKKNDEHPGITYDKKYGVYLKAAATRLVNQKYGAPVPYVLLRINEKTKQLSIEPTSVKSSEARNFMCDRGNPKNVMIRWTDNRLAETIERMLPDKTLDRVVIPMNYDEESGWFVINIEEAAKTERKRKEPRKQS